MSRNKGYQLGKRFNKYNWENWDNQTPEERSAYEQRYEDRDNNITDLKIKATDALQV